MGYLEELLKVQYVLVARNWIDAMNEENQSLMINKTRLLVSLTKGAKVISCK